jgi:hypothetical protein
MRWFSLVGLTVVCLAGCSGAPQGETAEQVVNLAKSAVDRFARALDKGPDDIMEELEGLKDSLSSLSDDDPDRLAPVMTALADLEQTIRKSPRNRQAIKEKTDALAAAAGSLSPG